MNKLKAFTGIGIFAVGICFVMAVMARNIFMMIIALAWAAQVYVTFIVLNKYSEGKKLDDQN